MPELPVQGPALPRLFSASLDGTVREWAPDGKATGRGVKPRLFYDAGEAILSMACNARYLYIGTKSGRLLVRDLSWHELRWPEDEPQPYRDPHEEACNDWAFREANRFGPGRVLVAPDADEAAHQEPVTACWAGETRVCSGYNDGSIHLWEVATGKYVAALRQPHPVPRDARNPNLNANPIPKP